MQVRKKNFKRVMREKRIVREEQQEHVQFPHMCTPMKKRDKMHWRDRTGRDVPSTWYTPEQSTIAAAQRYMQRYG